MKDDIEFDANCDPDNPVIIKYDNIVAAQQRIANDIVRSPCTRAHMSENLNMEIYFKKEFLQYTGSFKERGVRNALLQLSEEQKKFGVISASTGNHGLAMSYHATLLSVPCIVVMPITAAMTKVAKCEKYGAKVILHGNIMADCKRYALGLAKDKNMLYINGYDYPQVCEGQGTVGLEVLEQVPNVDAVIVPVGGGSLLCGIAVVMKQLKPDVEVYGICTDKTTCMAESLRRNERVMVQIDSSLADGLAVSIPGVNPFHTLKKTGVLDKMIVVKEEWVARAVTRIVEEERIVVEGAGACPVAGIIAGLFPNLKGKTVVCILSGGNIDTSTLARALERGMAAEGRLVKFKVTVSDRPGGMAELCSLLASIGVTIRDCIPERAWVKSDVFSVENKVIVETRGWDHTKVLQEAIKKNYKLYYFPDFNEAQNKSPAAKRGPCLAPNPVCMQK